MEKRVSDNNGKKYLLYRKTKPTSSNCSDLSPKIQLLCRSLEKSTMDKERKITASFQDDFGLFEHLLLRETGACKATAIAVVSVNAAVSSLAQQGDIN